MMRAATDGHRTSIVAVTDSDCITQNGERGLEHIPILVR
jgi:hypothetical protein